MMRRLALLACVLPLLLAFACSDDSPIAPPGSTHWEPVAGLGTVVWSEQQMDSGEADAVIADLQTVLATAWPEYQRIYGVSIAYYMDRITLDTTFYKPAEMLPGVGKMTLNPRLDYRRGFGAELHNLIRWEMHGPQHVYCDEAVSIEDAALCLQAEAVWQGLL